MKILITGGAGFIGSNLADKFIERGDKVFIIDNLLTGRLDNVNDKAIFFKETIANQKEFRSFFIEAEPDVVIHAAASYKEPDLWEFDVQNNILGTINVIRNCEEFKVKRLIYFETSLCYGNSPIEQPITLTHPINPTNTSYAITKTAAELFIFSSNLNYVTFRLANCYGPRNTAGAVPSFYIRLKQDIPCFAYDTRRDFIFIDDLMNVVIKAADGIGKGTYHISTGKDYAIKEVYDIVAKCLGINKEAELKPILPDDVFSILLDPSKTIDTFKVEPKTPLEEGIEKAVKWYESVNLSEFFTHLRISK